MTAVRNLEQKAQTLCVYI